MIHARKAFLCVHLYIHLKGNTITEASALQNPFNFPSAALLHRDVRQCRTSFSFPSITLLIHSPMENHSHTVWLGEMMLHQYIAEMSVFTLLQSCQLLSSVEERKINPIMFLIKGKKRLAIKTFFKKGLKKKKEADALLTLPDKMLMKPWYSLFL